MNSYYPNENQRLLGWFPISPRYACWAELLLIQLITPNASFIGHMAGILVGLLYTAGPLKWVTDAIANIVGSVGGLPNSRSDEPSAPPMEDDEDNAYPGAFTGRGATTGRSSRFDDLTGGLSEEEQMRRAMEESLRHRGAPSYGWRS